MPLAGEKASAPPSLHSTIVAIADRVGSVIHKQIAQQVRNSRRAHQLSDFYVRGSASKSCFTGAIYLVGLSPSSLLSCFLQLEKARNPPAVKKSVGASLRNRCAHSSRYADFRILVPGWVRPRIGQFACFVQGPFASALRLCSSLLSLSQKVCLTVGKPLSPRGMI